MTKNKGFTLIELLLVIGIVSVLASIFMFNATEAKKKAQDSRMVQESKQVATAIELYKDQNGFVPHSTTAGVDEFGKIYQEGGEDDAKYRDHLKPLVDQKILPKIPTSPDGISYAYGVSTDKKNAVFVANLKTRSSGNSGNDPEVACVAVGDEYSDQECSDILVPIDEDLPLIPIEPPPIQPPLENPPYAMTLNGPQEYVELVFGQWYEITYAHNSVNVNYSIKDDFSGDSVVVWFNYDGTAFVLNESGFNCDNQSISEGETSYCDKGSGESITIINHNSASRILKIRAW